MPPGCPNFYAALGWFEILHDATNNRRFTTRFGGEAISTSSPSLLSGAGPGWGRVIFYVADVDALYFRTCTRGSGCQPTTAPRDAGILWGERFFHLIDPTVTNLVSHAPLCGPRCRLPHEFQGILVVCLPIAPMKAFPLDVGCDRSA